ncbi:MAG: 1,4-beta-xylanase [Gorillibacterium sp.]|nr:1,4-beta-xylanase [Gorillibacterium sp.]
MTWGFNGRRGMWASEAAAESMTKMADLGINWVTLAFGVQQAHPQATIIPFREAPTVEDDEVRAAIHQAQALGLKVCLKPVVNCANGTWRAHINFFDQEVPGEPSWAQWFASYREFMLHYAVIAREEGCELLCIGCEMVQTDKRELEWRELIRQVREVYPGPITYNCDKYQEDRVKWWDAVDIISSSGYYPIGQWEEQLDRIEQVVRKFDKPFFFMETGCPSRDGSGAMPNDWTLVGGPNETEQDLFYQSMFTACIKRDWVQGYMLWDWPTNLYPLEAASSDNGYLIYGKKAEKRVKDYYTTVKPGLGRNTK